MARDPSAESGSAPRPQREPDSAGRSDENSRLTNAARALALGALLSGRRVAVKGVEQDLEELGVPTDIPRPATWKQRRYALDEANSILRRVKADNVVERESELRSWPGSRSTTPHYSDQRVELWRELRKSRRSMPTAYAWLRLLMAEDDPLVVVSASAALSHWKRPKGAREEDIPVVLTAARRNARALVDDTDELTSAIAQASVGIPSQKAVIASEVRPQDPSHGKAGDSISLMIHGTFAWADQWWFPGGGFHEYVRASLRPNLYGGQDAFSWSGRYRARDRTVAADRLAGWVQAKGSPIVDAVFAHSYGGAVALQATMNGLRMNTAVLLSTPVDNYEVEWRNINRAVSLRIHCDLVLLAARTRQRFTANVEEHWLNNWFVHHWMSHDAGVWTSGGWASTLGIL